MRIPFLAPLLVLPLVGAVSHAAEDGASPWYLQFNVGVDSPEDSAGAGGDIAFDEGYALSAALGYELFTWAGGDVGCALELEGFLSDTDVDRDHFGDLAPASATAEDTSTAAVLVNAVLDWRWTEKISLYGGAGVGQALRVQFNTFNDSDRHFKVVDSSVFAVQGKVGLRYRLGGNASWSIGYRYLQTEDLELRDEDVFGDVRSFDMSNRHHVLEFGVGWGI